MFTPVPTRLEDILNSPTQFAIPVYQREYKWGKEEALELIEDLESYTGADDSLFLGNLIFERARNQKTFVVDGQQRLTTIWILLIACRMQARKLGLSNLEPYIQGKITFVDTTTGASLGTRLLVSDTIRDVFEHMANHSWNGAFPHVISGKPVKRKINKIKPIYDSFLGKVSSLDAGELSKFLRAIYDAYVARIEVESEVEALSIFERTNARGLDLEISDLLKNYLFTKKVEGIEDQWAQITENAGGTIIRMLKYFYVSQQGPVLKSQLYKKLKEFSGEVGAPELTKQLSDFSTFYRIVKTPDKGSVRKFYQDRGISEISAYPDRYERINRALEALREFGIMQFCAPAYAAIGCVERNRATNGPGYSKKLIYLIETFEKYHFINNVICERVGNEVEKLYADACKWYIDSPDFIKTTDRLVNELRSKLASQTEFEARFSELSYSQDSLSLLNYIFDRFENSGLDPAQCIQIYNPDPKLKRRNHSIEHFLPQNPSETQRVKKSDMELVDNIGNLLAVYFKDNSKLGNASPEDKIGLLKGALSQKVQNLTHVKDFIARYESDAASWDAEKIRKRARSMARDAYQQVWKIS